VGARLLLVGFDGAEASLVADGITTGTLPTLAALRRRGLWDEVDTPPGLSDDACWCSFATGTEPATHRHRFYKAYRPGTYDWVKAPLTEVPVAAFWNALAADGLRFVVVDAPKSPLGHAADNVVITDWLAHHAHTLPTTTDGDVGRVLDAEMTWNCSAEPDPDALTRTLFDRADARTRLTCTLLARDSWDCCVVVFGETHCVGHSVWGRDDVVRDVYREVDHQLQLVLEAAGADTVIAFSVLGMGPHANGDALLDAVLRRLDQGRSGPVGNPRARRRSTRAMEAARPFVPRPLRRRAPQVVHQAATDVRARDFGRRRFWTVPTDFQDGSVRLNVEGREPHGKIRPGADFVATCDDLRRALLELRDPDHGERLVAAVLFAHDRGEDPMYQDVADLHVVWARPGLIASATSPRVGVVRVESQLDRLGNHRPGGWFVAAGAGVTPGTRTEPARLVDFAPTVASVLGAPDRSEGKPLF
jgi:predicted AlkP superfamily phosphohydrolase/phosphomutase